MDQIFKKTRLLFLSKQGSIISSTIIISTMIIFSSLFGFLRYRLLAGFFNKEQLDIFFASFRIPDLIFEVLITGALTSTFIPIFIKYQKNKEELDSNISSIINFISLLMIVFIGILLIFLDKIIPAITPGYTGQKIEQIINFSRILLVAQLPLMIVGNFLTGIGQANKRFILSATAPILYNIAIIVATILFANNFSLQAPIFGVVLGAILFFIVQLPALFSSNFSYKFVLNKTKGFYEFIRMVIPRALTVIVAQIDATVDLTLSTVLGSGSYTVFYLAQHLQLLPVSVIGVAYGQASLPYLSEIFNDGQIEQFKKIVIDSILNLFFLTIPIASFFIFARTPLVRLFFGGQKFDWDATVATAFTLSYFAASIPIHSTYYFLTRCFYALMDSRTPFFISGTSILINTALSIFFVFFLKLPVWALAISFSTAIIINVVFLFAMLWRRVHGFNLIFPAVETIKMLLVTGVSSFITYYFMKLMDGLVFDTSRTINVFFLLLTGGIVYMGLYLFLAWVIDVKEIYLLSKFILKAKEYKQKIIEIYTGYE